MTKPTTNSMILIMNSVNKLFQKAILLPEDQCLSQAHKHLAGVEPEWIEEVSQSWGIEIRNRKARYDNGESFPQNVVCPLVTPILIIFTF